MQAYLATPEGREVSARYHAVFAAFYKVVEPHGFETAARAATADKIEREHVRFPDFGVWVLERRHAVCE